MNVKMGPNFHLALFFAVYVARCSLFIDALRQGCSDALGMESNKIKDFQISSHTFSPGWLPEHGRLNNNNGAWCSANNDKTSEYFEIDLLRVRHVSAIGTQGVQTWNYLSYYVKTYVIKYSYDGRAWLTYKDTDDGPDKSFIGNSNANSVKLNNLRDTFVTRYLRIYPKDYKYDMCLRVEVYGCSDQADDCSNFSTNPSGSIASPGFPISYPSNKNCVWIISAPTGKNMVLMFTQFDMRRSSNPPGCKEDFVEVQDGLTDLSPRIGGKFCNGNTSMLTITTTSTVRVNFHSGNTNAAQKGFQINYLAITPGSGNIHAEKACDGDVLALNCSGYQYTIKILHATYGSFPHSCGQQLSSQSCPTVDVKSKVVTMCQDSKECDITVKKALFDYSCSNGPENHQLQIFYQCTSTNIRTPAPSTITSKPTQVTSSAPSIPPTKRMSSGPSAKPTQMTFSAPSNAQPTKVLSSNSFTKPTTKSSSEKPVLYPSESDKITLPTENVEFEDPGVTGKRAETRGGLQMEVMIAVIAVVFIVGVAVVVAVFVIRKKCSRKDRGSPLPTITYTSDKEYATPANGTKKRFPRDSKANPYETVNILYPSSDSSENSTIGEKEVSSSDSCPVDQDRDSPKITENPLYIGIKPPNGAAQSHYSLPVKKTPKVTSIENPNYEKTLPLTNHEYAKPEIKTDTNC